MTTRTSDLTAFVLAALALTACTSGPEDATVAASAGEDREVSYDLATGVEDEVALPSVPDDWAPAPLEPESMGQGTGTVAAEADSDATGAAYKVFGADGRYRVTPTTGYPARTQVSLRMTFADGFVGGCSGTMIGDRYVLTAGHCVYAHDHRGWASSVQAWPGRDGSYAPFGSAWATRVRALTAWTVSAIDDSDFALITLGSNLGARTGWLGLAALPDATLRAATSSLFGYPGDKLPAGSQWGMTGSLNAVGANVVLYRLDSYGGQSGSSVYTQWNGGRYVFAVHDGSGFFGGVEYNRAARITSARFYTIVNWMATGT